MRVCLYGQDRTHRSSSRRSGAACETGERSQHAAEDRVAVADRAFGRRGDWRGRGGEEGGQERAHRAPLAATLRGQGGGGVVEGRDPPGRKPLTARKIKQVVNLTLNEKPSDATHWSERMMAARAGIAPSSVHKIWVAHGLKPHLTKTFKLSRDPNFVAKVEDIVGLYLNPPDKSLVLAVDEKSQIQALDRTQPGLPMKKGRCGTMTHDYKRNGTTTLFAALNMLDGTVICECMPRHRHPACLRVPK